MSCKECGLYRNCISAKMKPESLFVENSKGTVLVIGSYPSAEEDQESKFFVGASELLRDMLSGLEEEGISWVYTTALRCHPGKDFEGNYVKATDEHIAHWRASSAAFSPAVRRLVSTRLISRWMYQSAFLRSWISVL